ncbi:glycosyltransferase family 2 protein [bacterium]|nr:glycosyltransferase family 2 protein [bacterium]
MRENYNNEILLNYSLIIPIYNEGRSLNKLLNQLQEIDDLIEIIIVNDGSNDNTEDILNNQNLFKVINHHKNSGKGASIISGINNATNENIILMDGDLEIEMSSVIKGIKSYEINSPNVIINGCRWGENNFKIMNINTYGNFLINFIFNKLYKTKINDVLCCLKIFEKKTFKSLNITSKSFSIEIELMSKLALIESRFYEIKVKYNRRKKSEGKKLKLSDGWGILWKMFYLRFKC